MQVDNRSKLSYLNPFYSKQRTSSEVVSFELFGHKVATVDLTSYVNYGLRKTYNSISGIGSQTKEGVRNFVYYLTTNSKQRYYLEKADAERAKGNYKFAREYTRYADEEGARPSHLNPFYSKQPTSSRAVSFEFFGHSVATVNLGRSVNYGLRKTYNSISGLNSQTKEGVRNFAYYLTGRSKEKNVKAAQSLLE